MSLEPCKFCGGTPAEPRVDQIEFDSWSASIDCTDCEVTLTMQYGCDSIQEASDAIAALWNSEPEGAA
ncbi:Lar family restriction alleviation protein [Burkholderia pyrrocinia]|uniref:Lar family restriction alleviation protein n=1 Tax=Burkholderia pyrrocinia TaxID=60550 RepID=UPI001588ED9C|nr:Lar family restriction alleviation protein [Burkholderia pyrrocinia]